MATQASPRPRRRSRAALVLGALALLLACAAFEAYRAYVFYDSLSQSRAALIALKDDIDLDTIQSSQADLDAHREELLRIEEQLVDARRFADQDPGVFVATKLPLVGRQARGLKTLVRAAEVSAQTGVAATDVAIAFRQHERDPGKTSVEDGLVFLTAQEPAMAKVRAGVDSIRRYYDVLPEGLVGPMAAARAQLSVALPRLEALVDGYERADALLPEVLGYNGSRNYLVLPQNDTELFPSGGLISSYGIAGFDGGRLTSMNLEYFGALFDRWQTATHEYIEPPGPLKNYLKRSYSWALGEAGWYPDFETTAGYATDFVKKGGAPDTDGVIAIDLQFVKELLGVLGPVAVPEYGVTVTPDNLYETALELTRDDNYVPGKQQKAFLSYLSRSMLTQLFSAPKDRWLALLRFLDRMGRERHLQLQFDEPRLQAIAAEYGLDGALQDPDGDFLMIADTSVNSTKLNLILRPRASINLQLRTDGSAQAVVGYSIENPFPDWARGRDLRLVSNLMYEGVYGSYLRVYAIQGARLMDVRLDGKSAGAEQSEVELGKQVFGRFMPVLPGTTRSVEFYYRTDGVVMRDRDGSYRYELLVQKEAGTVATPLDLHIRLPAGAQATEIRLDGQSISGFDISTDLRVDRRLQVVYR